MIKHNTLEAKPVYIDFTSLRDAYINMEDPPMRSEEYKNGYVKAVEEILDVLSKQRKVEVCTEFVRCEPVKVTERGWAGHFILGSKCKFHRNTLIEYKDKKWIVSTVGNLDDGKNITTIGACRYYETMAFEAEGDDPDSPYIDADVMKGIDFDSPWELFAENVDEFWKKYPDPDNHANRMHGAVVKELIEKIQRDDE